MKIFWLFYLLFGNVSTSLPWNLVLHPSLIVIFPVRNMMLYLINPCKQYFLIVQFIDPLHITSPVFLAVDAVLTEIHCYRGSNRNTSMRKPNEWSISIVSDQKGEYVHLPVKRSSLAMWRIMFSSGITDGNIKIRDTAWRFNDNGCTQDLFLFKSFSPSYKQYTHGLASFRITS